MLGKCQNRHPIVRASMRTNYRDENIINIKQLLKVYKLTKSITDKKEVCCDNLTVTSFC